MLLMFVKGDKLAQPFAKLPLQAHSTRRGTDVAFV